ncbi:glycosyltransferase family 2 protein [Labilibacter sediminis]|nr:glycosyltransferase family 2 protein [Labilibacter sediminis]
MKAFDKYLKKHPAFTSFDIKVLSPANMVIVIPVYLEDDLTVTLDSLCDCSTSDSKIAVLLVVNASEKASEDIIRHQKNTVLELASYKSKNVSLSFYTVEAFDLPRKHFGAGLARKIGMDLAVQHFLNTRNEQGVIVSLDADSIVDSNYLESLDQYFKNENNKGCSIYFEHPLEGSYKDQSVYDAITQYELHLRYFVECLRYISFPYAFHTIGSCFAVKASAYVSVGGMNRRQGGEEFYFIQKLIQQGGYGELNSTTVRPSSRISTRVPFGTGPSVKTLVESGDDYQTYNLQGFIDLKPLFEAIPDYYKVTEEKYQEEILKLPGRLRSFLLNSDFYKEIAAVSANCSTVEVFKKRFYHIFNAFKLVKYINYIHEHFLERVTVFDAAIELLQMQEFDVDDIFEERELLEKYRELQKQIANSF